jgi:hypothetical protein
VQFNLADNHASHRWCWPGSCNIPA